MADTEFIKLTTIVGRSETSQRFKTALLFEFVPYWVLCSINGNVS